MDKPDELSEDSVFGIPFYELDLERVRLILDHYKRRIPWTSSTRVIGRTLLELVQSQPQEAQDNIRSWYEEVGQLLPASDDGSEPSPSPPRDPHLGNLDTLDDMPPNSLWGALLDNLDRMGDRIFANRQFLPSPDIFPFEGDDTGSGALASTSGFGNAGPFQNENLRTCNICVYDKPVVEFPTRVTAACGHPPVVCFECMDRMLGFLISTADLKRIGCPECSKLLTKDDVKRFVSAEKFQRYEYLTFRQSMPESYVMCMALNCPSGQSHESEDPMMTCKVCQFKVCVVHKLPWHEGMTCEQFDAQDSEIERQELEHASMQLVADTAKPCPKCGHGVVKEVGCDELTCRCGYSWCYVCRAPWDEVLRSGGRAHAPDCKYRTPERSAARPPAMHVGNPFANNTNIAPQNNFPPGSLMALLQSEGLMHAGTHALGAGPSHPPRPTIYDFREQPGARPATGRTPMLSHFAAPSRQPSDHGEGKGKGKEKEK